MISNFIELLEIIKTKVLLIKIIKKMHHEMYLYKKILFIFNKNQ